MIKAITWKNFANPKITKRESDILRNISSMNKVNYIITLTLLDSFLGVVLHHQCKHTEVRNQLVEPVSEHYVLLGCMNFWVLLEYEWDGV